MEEFMSISGLGAPGSDYLSQIQAKMLSRLDSPQNTTSTTSSTSAGSTASTAAPPTGPDASNALSGTAQPTLSNNILALLVQLQSQTSTDGSQTSSNPNLSTTPTSSATSANSGNNPIQQLFAAMDSNGDGTVSQSEMEKYIESQGGTQSQADTLYSSLNQNGASGISEGQMASAAEKGHHGHGHHHHHDAAASNASSSNSASQTPGAPASDSDNDGTSSGNSLVSILGNSGSGSGVSAGAPLGSSTSGNSSNLFAAIDTNSDGSISQNELNSFLASLQQQNPFGLGTSTTTGSAGLANQSYNSTSILLNTINPSQALIA
jgi:Ca2+-binding EF-hand superfamily protein